MTAASSLAAPARFHRVGSASSSSSPASSRSASFALVAVLLVLCLQFQPSTAVECSAGTYAEGNSCLPCSAGFYCKAGSLNKFGANLNAAANSALLANVTTLAGSPTSNYLQRPMDIVFDTTNTYAYVLDQDAVSSYSNNSRLLKIHLSTGAVQVLVRGEATYTPADGVGTQASVAAPTCIALDKTNNILYFFDSSLIRSFVVANATVKTIAGSTNSGPIFSDGVGTVAKFGYGTYGSGLVVNADGTLLYVADAYNQRIRRVTLSSGQVDTIAGSGNASYADGVGTFASFKYPQGLALDSSGSNLYVADYNNHRIRCIQIGPGNSFVTITIAGSGTPTWFDGTGSPLSASFLYPTSISIDPSNSVLVVAEAYHLRLISLVSSSETTLYKVTTLAGSGFGYADGVGSKAVMKVPALAFDATGTKLVMIDSGNQCIRMATLTSPCPVGSICPAGSSFPTTCPAGSFCDSTGLSSPSGPCNAGFACFPGSTTPFGPVTVSTLVNSSESAGIALDVNSTFLYVAEYAQHRVRRVTVTTGAMVTIAGSGLPDVVDGVGTLASFVAPNAIALHPSGLFLYVMDNVQDSIVGNTLRVITLSTNQVVTIAGSRGPTFSDGVGLAATFALARRMVFDPTGSYLYIPDNAFCRIRRVEIATRNVTTIVGSGCFTNTQLYPVQDGVGTAARLYYPTGIAIDPSGSYLYVGNQGSSRIGTTYTSDNRVVRVDIASNNMTTIAGIKGEGSADGIGTYAHFARPAGLVLDPSGSTLFIAEFDTHRIRRLEIATNKVSTVIGTGIPGYVDGIGGAVMFNSPRALAIDSNGTRLFVSDSNNSALRVIKMGSVCDVDWFCPAGAAPQRCPAGTFSNSGAALCSDIPVVALNLGDSVSGRVNASRFAYFNVTLSPQLLSVRISLNSTAGSAVLYVSSNSKFPTPDTCSADPSCNFFPSAGLNVVRYSRAQNSTTISIGVLGSEINGAAFTLSVQPIPTIDLWTQNTVSVAASQTKYFVVNTSQVPCSLVVTATPSAGDVAIFASNTLPLPDQTSCAAASTGSCITSAQTSGVRSVTIANASSFGSITIGVTSSAASASNVFYLVAQAAACPSAPVPTGGPSPFPTAFPVQTPQVSAVSSLKLGGDVAQLQAFAPVIAASCARALNISASRVSVLGMRAGSVIVDLSITPDASSVSAPSPQTLINALITQAASSTSVLATIMAPTAPVVTSYTPTVSVGTVYLCPDGSWQSTMLCLTCPAGQYLNGASCQLCAPGTFTAAANSASTCSPCNAGTYASISGATSCTSCASGLYSSTLGATSASTCQSCAAGSATGSASGASTCTQCAAGTWAASSSSACTQCSAGSYSASLGATSSNTCLSCASGLVSTSGSSACTQCPSGNVASANGASCQASGPAADSSSLPIGPIAGGVGAAVVIGVLIALSCYCRSCCVFTQCNSLGHSMCPQCCSLASSGSGKSVEMQEVVTSAEPVKVTNLPPTI